MILLGNNQAGNLARLSNIKINSLSGDGGGGGEAIWRRRSRDEDILLIAALSHLLRLIYTNHLVFSLIF